MIEENVWSNPRSSLFERGRRSRPGGHAVRLVKAFGEVLDRAKLRPVYEVESPT